MTPLAKQILALMREMRVPVTVNDLVHRLGVEPADALIAVHELMQAGSVRSKLRGMMQRPYYELT